MAQYDPYPDPPVTRRRLVWWAFVLATLAVWVWALGVGAEWW